MKSAIQIKILLVFLAVAHSKPCEKTCGGIKVPFPFGIGKGCYSHEYHEVTCRNSIPFLEVFEKEIVGINVPKPMADKDESDSIPLGSIRIKTRITIMGCSGAEDEIPDMLDFTGSPFHIGENHTLVAFGCNNTATTVNMEPRLVGCISSCNKSNLYIPEAEVGKRCNGFKCCNVMIAGDVGAEFGVKIDGTRRECSVAFLTDAFHQNPQWENITEPTWFLDRQYSTIRLKWAMFTTNTLFGDSLLCTNQRHAKPHSNPCHCSGDTMYELRNLSCACTYGYEGNPYEVNGCKDIDECKVVKKDGRLKHCTDGQTCKNVPGSYRCLEKKDKTSLIYIGVGIGLSVLLVGVGIWLYKFMKRRRKMKRRNELFERNGGLLLQQLLTSVEKTKVFSFKELEKATESFGLDRVLGQGGHSTVYKGIMDDGTVVAVKKAKVVDEDKVEEFINELVILSQINHSNIVKILGCCLETDVPLIIYEFIPKGNVYEHLHRELDDNIMSTWEVRLQIAIDVAGALAFLHSAASSPVFHRDVKSANIMLDENYRAKVADFGTSRLVSVDHTHLTTVVSGTVGYVDPEYFQSGLLTEKSDVYSYAVVLVELMTGEMPMIPFKRFQKNMTLATYFLIAMEENRLFDVMDPRIKEDCQLDQVTKMAELAMICLDIKGENRPKMTEVSKQLEKISSMRNGQVSKICRRSLSMNGEIASSSGSNRLYGRLFRSHTEPLLHHLSG